MASKYSISNATDMFEDNFKTLASLFYVDKERSLGTKLIDIFLIYDIDINKQKTKKHG